MKLFKTFKPKIAQLQKYISYYYLDTCDDLDYFNEYVCYPHFNTTLSFYKSNTLALDKNHNTIRYSEKSPFLKVLTPIREHQLKVTQIGKVHKIAIVFNPLGVNQFLKNKKINGSVVGEFENFDPNIDSCLNSLFNITNEDETVSILDDFLLSQLSEFNNEYVENALKFFHDVDNIYTIEEIAEKDLGISRKHLNQLFISYLNITPQKYRMIVRFRHLVTAKLHSSNTSSLTNLAYFAKYADQSHFIKACKQLTGLNPKQFFVHLEEVGSEDIFWTFSKIR